MTANVFNIRKTVGSELRRYTPEFRWGVRLHRTFSQMRAGLARGATASRLDPTLRDPACGARLKKGLVRNQRAEFPVTKVTSIEVRVRAVQMLAEYAEVHPAVITA